MVLFSAFGRVLTITFNCRDFFKFLLAFLDLDGQPHVLGGSKHGSEVVDAKFSRQFRLQLGIPPEDASAEADVARLVAEADSTRKK